MKYLLPILFFFSVGCASAQDTTCNTVTTPPHDTSITTTIPAKYIPRDTTIFVDDIAHNDYLISGHYVTIGGPFSYDSTLYDTIPAHDSTFTTSITHDTIGCTITLHPITLRPNNQNKALGATFTFANNGTQLSITGGSLKPGDVVVSDNSASTGAASGAASGTYPITLSSVTIMRGATNVTSTYAINYQQGTLTVAGAIPITIRADDQGKTQGQVFTFLHNGTQVSVTSGTLNAGDVITVDNAASTGSGSGAAAGTYTIFLNSATITNGTTNVTSNYVITYVTGTLTVTATPQVITVRARNQTKQYGSTFTFLGNGSQVQVVSGSLNAGDAITADNATSTGAGPTAVIGSYTISLSSITIMNGATNVTGNYTITYQTGTLTVTTKPITVKANNQSKVQGNTFTFTHDGTQVSVVSGSLLSGNTITVDNAASTGAASGALTGAYPITLSSITIMSGATNVTANYSITYQGGTLSVSSPPGAGTTYGIFPIQGPTYPNLQARMNHAHYVGVPLFRYNYDYDLGGGNYSVGQILDNNLTVSLTFNHVTNAMRNNGDVSFPNTTAEINFYSSKLDSLLGLADKPEIVHINNEEGHREYWEGTAAEYLVWMEKCVQVSHSHGIPCTNGGTTLGIVYAMLRWYEDNGKPIDSINFIKTAFGITGSANGAYATEQRIWYQTLLAGFANSAMDYVNMHWYEPARDNYGDVVASGLLPLLINYVQTVTGKGVITTETGTKNSDWGLLFALLDQWKASGARYVIYYAGTSDTGAHAYDNSEGYKSWLLLGISVLATSIFVSVVIFKRSRKRFYESVIDTIKMIWTK